MYTYFSHKYSPLASDEILKTIPNVCKISGKMELDTRYGPQMQYEDTCFWNEAFSISNDIFSRDNIFTGQISFADTECNYKREEELLQLQWDFQAIVEMNGGHLLRYGHEVERYPDIPNCTPEMQADGKKYHIYSEDVSNIVPFLHFDEPFTPHTLSIVNKENIVPGKNGFTHIEWLSDQDYFPAQYTPDVPDAVLRTIPNVCRIPYEFIPTDWWKLFSYFQDAGDCYVDGKPQIETPFIEWQMLWGKYIQFLEKYDCNIWPEHAKYLTRDGQKMELLIETGGRQILRYENVGDIYWDFPECDQEIFDAWAQFRVKNTDVPFVSTFLVRVDEPFVPHELSEGRDVSPIPYISEEYQEMYSYIWTVRGNDIINIIAGVVLFLFIILLWQHFKKPKHLRKK